MQTSVLLIGINEYPGSPLNGCVPDIEAWADFLPGAELNAKGRAYKYSDLFAACTDKRASARGLKERLARAVMTAAPGDRIFVAYSGHGAPVTMRGSAGEVDGLSESLCAVDFSYDDEDTWLTDVDLIETFSRLPEGVACTIVLDSCFSGGMTAGAVMRSTNPFHETKNRGYPITNRVDFGVRMKSAAANGIKKRKIVHESLTNVAVIMGCQEDQTCADAWMDDDYQGAFTYYLIQALREDLDRSLLEAVEVTAGKLKAAGFDQVPTIAGLDELIKKPFGASL
jgi:hypothetical protein